MPVPVGLEPMLADYLEGLEARLAEREVPGSPQAPFACLEADLPLAAEFRNCVLYVTDLKILAVSDGADWLRQDTGAAI